MLPIFLDTEFTGLDQRWPRLISISLVSEDGQHSFYAEVAADGYIDKVTPWVQANALPLLEGGDRIMQPDELRQRLAKWIAPLGAVRVVTDAPDFDFAFLRSTLDPWPENVNPRPFRFDTRSLGEQHRETLEAYRRDYFTPMKPEHHALHDAWALRHTWQQAKVLEAFQAFSARMEPIEFWP